MTTKSLLSDLEEYYLKLGITKERAVRIANEEAVGMILKQVKKGITPIKLITDNHITLNL